jgi:hypothetical protein
MKPKKLKFIKAKRKLHVFEKAFKAIDELLIERMFGVVRQALFFASEATQGRINISPLLSDAAKEEAYEAGFPGFRIQLPQPKPAFPSGGREFIVMNGRQGGKKLLHEMLYGQGGEPESVISYQERVRRFQQDKTIEFNPGPEVVNDSPYAAFRKQLPLVPYEETILEKRLREIRAKQAEAGSLPANTQGPILEGFPRTTEAPEESASALG